VAHLIVRGDVRLVTGRTQPGRVRVRVRFRVRDRDRDRDRDRVRVRVTQPAQEETKAGSLQLPLERFATLAYHLVLLLLTTPEDSLPLSRRLATPIYPLTTRTRTCARG